MIPFGAPMSVSQAGVNLVKRHEGLRLVAYYDLVGVLTIGYGCTTDVAPGMKISAVQAEERLRRDLQEAEKAVNELVTVPLTQGEFDALVSFTFNLGRGRLQDSTLLRLLNEGDKDAAAYEFRKWTRAGDKHQPGLVARRYDEQKLFESA